MTRTVTPDAASATTPGQAIHHAISATLDMRPTRAAPPAPGWEASAIADIEALPTLHAWAEWIADARFCLLWMDRHDREGCARIREALAARVEILAPVAAQAMR